MTTQRHANQTRRPRCGGLGLGALVLGASLAQAQTDDPKEGFRLMADRSAGNCVACHALPGQAGVTSDFGPALAQVASRYNAAQLRQWVTDARQLRPDTRMPPFGSTAGLNRPNPAEPVLTAAQIDAVVLALQSLR